VNVLLAPDIYVNASVALRSPPDQVVQRVLGKHKGETSTSEWVLARVRAMLSSIPEFKPEQVDQQLKLIRGFVKVIDVDGDFGPDAWEAALVAAAKKAGADRVITDHPDLLKEESTDGVEFISSEAWIFEATTPPPTPD
jgi:hypothetical protein